LYIKEAHSFNDPIHCTIKHGNIDWAGEFDPYTTLSYCCGEVNDDGSHLGKPTLCDGKLMGVRSNLETALRYIRQRQNDINRDLFADPLHNVRVPVWIDVICIDQDNTLEKTHQIKQMAEIYSNSSRLVVWLGVPTEIYNPFRPRLNWEDMCDELRRCGILGSPSFSRRWVIEEYGLTPIHSRFFLSGWSLFACYAIHEAFHGLLDKLQRALAQYDMFGYDPSNSLLYNLYRFDGAACFNTTL
jgi:hypothetical protein